MAHVVKKGYGVVIKIIFLILSIAEMSKCVIIVALYVYAMELKLLKPGLRILKQNLGSIWLTQHSDLETFVDFPSVRWIFLYDLNQFPSSTQVAKKDEQTQPSSCCQSGRTRKQYLQ